ncbi:polysaccharide deacetylase [Anaerobacillus alkaliphilus]|uniref:Polysaccharide deacetylase n=1 Tax=Anaerobacillus alkaliphilus TaxID=1548597 RepID=A0A4Q0VTB3_9BACI|nr:polysaccharide deacetylase family protein [Anaerobacillus alkaliphilus]RXI98680.1 polysaccharide deacetylase [Anaerobacillus alkaliphilus]
MRTLMLLTMAILALLLPLVIHVTKDTPKNASEHTFLDTSKDEISSGVFPRFHDDSLELENLINEIKKTSFKTPKEWGETVSGVINHFSTDAKIIALTFDACGGKWGSGYDADLIDFLINENIPATLFINSRWIDANLDLFLYLASLDQFQIENHGTEHRPLSLIGGTAWGIKGTTSVEEVLTEVTTNYKKIKNLTGHSPIYFRAGTAYYDEVAVSIVELLGMKVVNYDILGDAGATYSPNQVKEALLKAKPGSIALLHMNQPTKGTAEGVKMAIPLLKERGFSFVTLDEGFELSSN